MDLDRFKSAWQQQDPGPAIRASALRIERTVFRRDMLETAVALAVVPLFAVIAWKAPNALARFGAVWCVAAAIFVIVRLWTTRRRTPPADPSLPVREFCDREIARVEDQIRLLETVAWWYVGPLVIGPVLLYVGVQGWNQKSALYAAGVAVLGIVLTMANRHAARTKLRPLAERLRQWRDSLSGGAVPVEDPRKPALDIWRAIRSRDRIETAMAALGIAGVAAISWVTPSPLTRFGALWMACAWLFIVTRLRAARKRIPPPDVSLPPRDFRDRELRRIAGQSRLLMTVPYWYLAPLLSGALILIAGVFGMTVHAVGPCLAVFAFAIFATIANRTAVKQQLEPLAEQLRAWKDSL